MPQHEISPASAGQLVAGHIDAFFLAFLVSILVAPLLRWLAVRNGIVDRPDPGRKMQTEPVAYLGGVAIFLGWLVGVMFSGMVVVGGAERTRDTILPFSLVFGATVIMVTGLIDDVYKIAPRVKVGGQFLAAAALAWSSQNMGTKLVIDTFEAVGFSVPFELAYVLGAAVIAMFVVGGCNAMNLLDGLDGLAAGVTAIMSLGFLFIAVQLGTRISGADLGQEPIMMCLAILGAVMGFLPYNFNPANMFMGDAGSLLLGYLCVSTILLFANAPNGGPILVTAALIVFALPIMDMVLTISRRALKRQALSQADKRHLHHKLLGVFQRFDLPQNLSVKLAVLTMYGLAATFTILGCLMVFLRWRYILAVFFAIFGFVVVGAYKAGRQELLLESQPENEKEDLSASPSQAERSSELTDPASTSGTP